MRIHLTILFFPFSLLAAGQEQHTIDSLKAVINNPASHDTNIVRAYFVWDDMIYNSDPDLILNKKVAALCAKKLRQNVGAKEHRFYQTRQAAALYNIGHYHKSTDDFSKAINYYIKSLRIRETIADTTGMAASLNNIGVIYDLQGDYDGAIRSYALCLKLREAINDKKGMASALNNLGIVYSYQNDYANAIAYYERSMDLRREIDDRPGEAASLNNIGNIYYYRHEYAKALEYYTKALVVREETGNRKSIAYSLNNIGGIYMELDNPTKALEYYNRSLRIKEELGDRPGQASTLNNIGSVYQDQGDYALAIEYSSRALSIAEEFGMAILKRDATQSLYESYRATGKHQQALGMYEAHIATRDSIDSEENQKEVIRQQYKYEYEKKEAVADAEHAAELAQQEAVAAEEQKKQYIVIGSVSGGLGLVVLFSIFLFNRFRVIRRQKGVIEEQKKEVDRAYDALEEKNTEITDSIHYARRIQSAILPPAGLVKEYLHESFILYKPKDIVAGDFYWFEVVGDEILYAAADCTGHGVPGAMVSVMCSNALSKAVKEAGITQPAAILDKAVEYLEQQFEKSEEDVKDGMDLALCSLNMKNNKLRYTGANNPLWIIPADAKQIEDINEVKADKQPVGKYDHRQPFTNQEVQLKAGDAIYIFSDGFVDQFGGEKGKKFKARPFRQLLLSIQNKTMQEQKQRIDDALSNGEEIWSRWMMFV